ncbi:hypothetical protein MHU86_25768 [Fragilaria crotonensis]|nr:hypothetical protein MHU86_25768 [Fragilaria crotonensis]
MDVTLHPAYRRRAGDGAVFSARKCPSGAEQTCELPFGFVWTPMSPSSTAALQESAPIFCITCLTYLNLYATFDEASGLWTCPLCMAKNVAPKELLSGPEVSAALVSPMVEYRQIVATNELNPTYVVVMDVNLPPNEAHAVAHTVQTLLMDQIDENRPPRTLALITFGQTVSLYQLGLSAGLVSADVVPPDDPKEDEGDLVKRRTRMASRQYFSEVRNDDDFATFWSCIVAVYGDTVKEEQLSRKELLKRKKEARLRGNQRPCGPDSAESPWIRKAASGRPSRCTGEAIQCAMDMASFASDSARNSRILLFTNGCPNLGAGTIVRVDNEVDDKVGVDVIDHMAMMGAMGYFEACGRDAEGGIDVFLSGAGSLGLQAYQALVDASGGYALPHESFASEQFAADLKYVLCQTKVNRSHTKGSSDSIDGCIADVRMSEFMIPSHVVGAMEVLPVGEGLLPHERAPFSVGASLAARHGIATNELPSHDHLAETLTRVRMGRYDPLSTLSFMLKVDDSITLDDKYAFFQCTIRYLELDGTTLVTKVSTQRLPIARSVHDFLDSMDEEVVPIVLGKEAVFRSIVGREDEESIDALVADSDRVELLAFEAQKDLDSTIHRVSGAYRLIGLEVGTSHKDFMEEGGVSSAHSSLGFAFPPELADALHRLFHLRRGSMLSPGPVRSMDDRAEIRNLFLRLPLDDCLCMMAPSLWSSGMIDASTAIILDPIPSDTMTLWDNRIIAADHHDCLFVWSGKATLDAAYDPIRERCKEFLLERSKTRFPMPRLHMLSEGDSMSRRFTSRLAPTHADPPEQQIAHFPQLASLSPEEIAGLRDKFRFYEESTDASFRRWFWSVASASSNARYEGMSLCD